MENEIPKISLAAARVNAKMTQDDTARALHVSKNTIVSWEKGSSQPKISQANALCDLYGMSKDFIFFPSVSN